MNAEGQGRKEGRSATRERCRVNACTQLRGTLPPAAWQWERKELGGKGGKSLPSNKFPSFCGRWDPFWASFMQNLGHFIRLGVVQTEPEMKSMSSLQKRRRRNKERKERMKQRKKNRRRWRQLRREKEKARRRLQQQQREEQMLLKLK